MDHVIDIATLGIGLHVDIHYNCIGGRFCK